MRMEMRFTMVSVRYAILMPTIIATTEAMISIIMMVKIAVHVISIFPISHIEKDKRVWTVTVIRPEIIQLLMHMMILTLCT